MSRTLALAWFGTVVAMTPVSAQAPGKLYRVAVLAQVEQSHSVVQRVAIDFRAGPRPELPHLARATLTRTPDALLAITTPAASAARLASTDIQIVLFGGQDAVSEVLVQSLSQPGGNVTGVVILARDLDAKRLNLLHEIVPRARRIGYVMYSLSPLYQRTAELLARIFSGASLADLPIEGSTKFELINLTTARALAVDIQHALLANADEVIE